MSVSTNQNRFSMLGDGSNVTFNFPGYFKAKSDMLVMVTDNLGNVSVKVLDVDYSIVGVVTAGFGYESGADIIFNVAPSNIETVILINNPIPLQNTVLALNSVYPPQKIESTLDSIILIIQRIFSLVSRAVTLKDGMIDNFDPSLPIDIASVANQGKVFITDPAGGNKFIMGPTADEIENAQGYSIAAAASEAAAEAAAILVSGYIATPIKVDTSAGDVNLTFPTPTPGQPRAFTYINETINGVNFIVLDAPIGFTVHGQAQDELGGGEVGQYYYDGQTTFWRTN